LKAKRKRGRKAHWRMMTGLGISFAGFRPKKEGRKKKGGFRSTC